MNDFIPPSTPKDFPKEAQKILSKVYSQVRSKWVKEHPKDPENKSNKEKAATAAWTAVANAGYKKNKEGKWVKDLKLDFKEELKELQEEYKQNPKSIENILSMFEEYKQLENENDRTPGIRRALRALAKTRRKNKQVFLQEEDGYTLQGKSVSKETFFKKIGGIPKSWVEEKKQKQKDKCGWRKRFKKDSVNRFDVFDITEDTMTEPFRETSEGYLKGRAIITNTGIFNYRQADGSILRELRTTEDVGNIEALESFKNIPLTNSHPNSIDNPHGVTRDNAKKLQVGFTGSDVRFDGHAVSIDMTITDGQTIDQIREGKRALSCGYRADLEMVSGNAFGQNPYNAVQKNIRGNHIAIVEKGRAGDLAKMKLRMDSTDAIRVDNIQNKKEERKMAKVIINDVEFEADVRVAEEFNILKQNISNLETQIKNKDSDFSKLQADNDSNKDKLDSANKEIENLKNQMLDETKIKEAVKQRISLVDTAVKHEIEVKEDMSDNDIKKEIILKAFPKADLTDKNDDYLNARYDSAIELLAEKVNIENKKKTVDIKPTINKDAVSKDELRLRRLRNTWKLDSKQAELYNNGKETEEIRKILEEE